MGKPLTAESIVSCGCEIIVLSFSRFTVSHKHVYVFPLDLVHIPYARSLTCSIINCNATTQTLLGTQKRGGSS